MNWKWGIVHLILNYRLVMDIKQVPLAPFAEEKVKVSLKDFEDKKWVVLAFYRQEVAQKTRD
ncbi:MAG: hypothetical protein CM1200mP16_02970 [Nitrospina sp.]|nr:MAG: hypothetical protein CM1200mP16_02970 [Nitrospina sp.]